MTKRIGAVVISIALVGTLFAGCGQKAAPAAETKQETKAAATETKKEEPKKAGGKITFSSNRTDLQNTLIPKWIEDFKKSNPGIEVAIETIKDYQPAMKVKMASNDLPDVWTVHNGYYTKEQLQQFNVDLSKFDFSKDFLYTDIFAGTDGKPYALPQGASCTGVIYNKKIFSEVGATVPKTLDEFIAVGKKIAATKKYTALATAAKAGWPLQYYWLDFMNNIAGDSGYKNSLATKPEPFTPDSPAVKAFTLLKTFKDAGILEKDVLSADWEPMKKEFRDGKVGMFILGPWFVPQGMSDTMKLEDIGMFPMPTDNSGKINIGPGPDVALGIAKNSKNAEAAEAFFKYMMDSKYADVGKDLGLLTARKSVAIDLPFAKEFDSYNANKLPATPDSKELNDVVNKVQLDYNKLAQEILAGKDVNKTFSDLNAKWKKALGK